MTQDISNAVNSSKLKYHEHLALKLNDPKTAPKNLLENTKNNSYWKHSFNTFIARSQLVTDFLVKGNSFHDYFSQQCMTVDNESSIPLFYVCKGY